MSLKDYKKKRDFSKTKEPEARKNSTKKNIFVVQKHDASNLHYDFRLEIDNVLKSWAIPKGPSLNPKDKRLAIETEDHPIDYAGFEGRIPEGQYGAGTVMVWDKGSFENSSKKDDKEISLKDAYKKGHITFILKGKKLKGEFSLIKTKRNNQWLLIKKNDKEADKRKNILNEDKSAKSGKTLKQIEKS
jgi:DNA ligase D-like protein (predicted 3'-phosphoesterase)